MRQHGIFINGVWTGMVFDSTDDARDALHEVFGETPLTITDADATKWDFTNGVTVEIREIM